VSLERFVFRITNQHEFYPALLGSVMNCIPVNGLSSISIFTIETVKAIPAHLTSKAPEEEETCSRADNCPSKKPTGHMKIANCLNPAAMYQGKLLQKPSASGGFSRRLRDHSP